MAVLVALNSFHAAGRFIGEGAEVPSSDPIVKGREHLFTTPDPAPVVEAATAAPGEKRATRPRARKAAAK